MSNADYHSKVRLENFTVFADATFEFCTGINAIIGENGTGKTHLLKAMYACQRPSSREVRGWAEALAQLFQCQDVSSIRRITAKKGATTGVHGHFGGLEWHYVIEPEAVGITQHAGFGKPVFVPALDMMAHSKGFQQAYNNVFLDFDLTCYDLVSLLMLPNRATDDTSALEMRADYSVSAQPNIKSSRTLRDLLGGDVVPDETTGRFFLQTATGRLEMPMIAEGLRKIASLVRLQDNNWLTPGTTLYWDEPEVSINPILMQALVADLLDLSRSGVQVLLTTHSYVILKELDLQTTPTDAVRYFALQRGEAGTTVSATDDFAMLEPNPILKEYDSLYDRELTRATGRNRNGERVR